MNSKVQNGINSQKLLGFSVMKHIEGLYVSIDQTNSRYNVYDKEFNPLLVGVHLLSIDNGFISVKTNNDFAIYSTQGKLLIKETANTKVRVNDKLVNVYGGGLLKSVITRDGKVITDVPKVENVKCVMSEKGIVYTLDKQGILYRGKEKLDKYIDKNNFSEYFYSKLVNGELCVYSLDTQECVMRQGCTRMRICHDKVLMEETNGKHEFYIYNNGLKKIKFNTEDDIEEISFIDNALDSNKMLILVDHDLDSYSIADLDGKIISKKKYKEVGREIIGNYLEATVSNRNEELLDLNGNTILTGDVIATTEYGIVVIKDNTNTTFDYDTLK